MGTDTTGITFRDTGPPKPGSVNQTAATRVLKMKSDGESVKKPIISGNEKSGMRDYFCPFCNGKLFRGNVAVVNMSCPHCFRYIRHSDFMNRKDPAA
jgi:hypothetical protein